MRLLASIIGWRILTILVLPGDSDHIYLSQWVYRKENCNQSIRTIDNRIWNDEVENHFFAITTRMVNIYENFWNDFKIDNLIIINSIANND